MADAAFFIWLLLSCFLLTEHASPASVSETSSSTDGSYRYTSEKAGERASIPGTTTTTSIDRQRVIWPTNMLVTTKSKFKSSHVVTLHYNNSTAAFWPMLKLMPFDIELNPGPISALTFDKPIYIMGDYTLIVIYWIMKPAIQKPFLIFVVRLIFRNWLLHLQELQTFQSLY